MKFQCSACACKFELDSKKNIPLHKYPIGAFGIWLATCRGSNMPPKSLDPSV